MAESKAFMRAIRAALGLAGTYQKADISKPFVVARIVPNLDAPEIKQAVAGSYLQSMGMLFETPASPGAALPPAQVPQDIPAFPDEEGERLPWETTPDEPEGPDGDYYEGGYHQDEPEPDGVYCHDCGRKITGGRSPGGKTWSPEDIAGYSQRQFGRVLCTDCQDRERKEGRR